MARTFTAAERGYTQGLRPHSHAKLEIQDSTGAFVDVTSGLRNIDWLNALTLTESIDQKTWSLQGSLLRNSGTLSLAPFRSDSLLNLPGGTYATMLDLWRKWKVSVAVTREGYPPTGSDWKELAQGRIDVIDVKDPEPVIEIVGRGEEAVLMDKWISTERSYSGSMESVMQAMLDDNLGSGVVTLYTPVSPLYVFSPAWTQQRMRLMDALVAVADKAGCVLRYRYDASNNFRLTLFKPDRAASSPAWTLGPSEYTAVTENKIDLTDVRNYVKLRFAHATLGVQTVISPSAAGSGTVSCTAGAATFSTSQAGVLINGDDIIVAGVPYTVSAFNGTTGCTLLAQTGGSVPTFAASSFTRTDHTTASITRFGRRDHEIDLSFETQVNDTTKAQPMTDAVRQDEEFPDLVQSFESLGLWFVQLHDYGKFLANGIHYDTDQFGGVTRISHAIANGTIKSSLGASGKPKGKYVGWQALPSLLDPTAQPAIPLTCRATKITSTPTQDVFRVAVSDPYPLSDVTITYTTQGTGSASPSSPQTIAKASVTKDIATTGYVDITVNRAAFGTGTGRITFTATAQNRLASPDAGEVPSLDRDTQQVQVRLTRISETADQIVLRLEAINPNANGTATVAYNAGGLTVSPASGGTFAATTAFGTTNHIDYTITRDTQGGTPRRVSFTVSVPGSIDGTDGVDVPPTNNRNQCQVYSTSAQSLSTSGNFFPVNWNAEQYDDGALHDNAVSNTRITIPSGGDKGVYYLSALVQFQSNATGGRTVRIVKNGSTILSEVILPPVSGDFTKVMVHAYEKNPTVGDYYEVHAKQASGGALNIGSNTGTINDGFFQAQQQLGG